jgi:uncharacterized protein YceH (UPF0502 family)
VRLLSLLEARVLGVLIEKALTVPDSYPLSLNSLVLGCNQKTARDPVIAASEAEVQAALDGLKSLHIVFEASGSRVARYEHNAGRVLGLPSQSVALLATLMLRGPQTASELRANSDRLHRFADLSSVEGFLDELAARPDDKGGPLALRLARAPGAREARWVHLLCGPPEATAGIAVAPTADEFLPASEIAALRANLGATQREIDALKAEAAELRALVDRLYGELGVSRS